LSTDELSGLVETTQVIEELLGASGEAILILQPDGQIRKLNERLGEWLGRSSQELVGTSFFTLFKTAQKIRVQDALADALSDGRAELANTRALKPDGTMAHFGLKVSRLGDEPNIALLVVARDISGSMQTGSKERVIDGQIKYAQKLESLGVLAGGVAHDFNNLLVGILGNAGLAMMELEQEHPTRESVQLIEAAAVKAAKLTEQVLSYSGRRKSTLKTVHLGEVVESMKHLLDISRARQVSLDYTTADDVPLVFVDPSDMQQILINLVTNASESHVAESGSVQVAVGERHCHVGELAEAVVGRGLPGGHYVTISVSDTGEGIAPENLGKLFEPSFSTRAKGRGLGLAAVRGIVESYHGAVTVRSEVGTGTELCVFIPARIDLQMPEETTMGSLDDWRGDGTILVIDDEESVRQVARETLSRFGFEVLTSVDGQEGVETFEKHRDEVVAVLLDVTMPGLSPEEALLEIRRMRSDVGVVISSGYGEAEASGRFAGYGWATFIQKPYRPVELAWRIRQLVESGS
jgi:PAS domain S-box-containing protein